MTGMTLDDEMEDLSSAEDFLDYFGVEYDPRLVQVNRLHILQRFHDYLAALELPEDEQAQRTVYARELQRAHDDFLHSDARTEKVLRVFQRQQPQTVFIPVEQIGKG